MNLFRQRPLRAAIALLLLAAITCNFPPPATETPLAVTPEIILRPPTDTPDYAELGTLSVSADGAYFESGDLTLEVAPGAAAEPLDFTLSTAAEEAVDDEEVFYRSPLYRLTGPLDLLNGDLTFTLQLPPEAFSDADSDPAADLTVILVQEAFAPSAGEMVTAEYRLPSEVDPEAQTVTATFTLATPAGVGRVPRPVAGLDLIPFPLQVEAAEDSISIKVEGRRCSTEVQSGHFLISYSGCAIEQKLVKELAQILEDQYQKLEDIGFSFSGGPDPIYVSLDSFSASASTGQPRAGQFNPSKRGAGYCTLSFNRSFLLTDAWSQAERSDLTATAGHELFHLVQFLYDPRWAYTKAVSPGPTLWFDEAAATWFEPLALDDPGFIPSNATANANFIRTPLYLAALDQASDHGYGASFFLHYLTGQYDDLLISAAYDQLRAGVYSGTAAEALDEAVGARDSSVGLQWPSFIDAYFAHPGDILAGFGGPTVTKFVSLKAAALAGTDDYEITFAPSKGVSENNPEVTAGTLRAGPDATLTLHFNLGDLTADAVRLNFDTKAGDTLKALALPGQVRVSVESPEWAGVLVYGLPREGGAEVPLAGAPWGFLSSGDPASASGSQIVVSGLSHSGGQGRYQGLLLVPFQYRGTAYREGQTLPVTLTLAYLSAPVEATATPEPTQAPLSGCDCANIAPGLAGLECRLKCEAIPP